MTDCFEYDVFLSHSSKDKPAVRELAERLKGDGLRVWLDEWVIQPGDSIPLAMEQGLERSRTLVLVMSQHAFASDWVTLERQTALFRDPANQLRRFIPLRLDDAPIKDSVRQFAYVDWREEHEDQYAKLLAACEHPATDRPVRRPKVRIVDKSEVLYSTRASICAIARTSSGRHILAITSGPEIANVSLEDREATVVLKRVKRRSFSDLTLPLAIVPGRDEPVTVDGSRVAVLSKGGKQVIEVFEPVGSTINSLAVSSDGKWVVGGADNGCVYVWNLVTRRLVDRIVTHERAINCVLLTPDSRGIISASSDGRIRLRSLLSGAFIREFKGHTSPVRALCVTQDSKILASGADDGSIGVWDFQTGKFSSILEGHTGPVRAVAFADDGEHVLSASQDSTIRFWRIRTSRCLAILKGHIAPVTSLLVAEYGNLGVSGSLDGTARLWDISSLRLISRASDDSVRYTNAKVLLVGDSGVGKSGLAIRLAQGRFEPTISTDAHLATQLPLSHDASTAEVDRDIWLWSGRQITFRFREKG